VDFAKMLMAGGVSLDRVAAAPTVSDMRALAKRRLPRVAFDIVDGAADGELTLRANADDLHEVLFEPRFMVDVSDIRPGVTVAGLSLAQPFALGPCGLMRMVGNEGEKSAVRGAGDRGVPYTISSAATWSMEEIAEEATGPLWFQLYMYRSEKIVRDLVERAKRLGAELLMVTVDLPVNGKRPRDHRNGMTIPPKITRSNFLSAASHPGWVLSLMSGPPIGFRNLDGVDRGDSHLTHQEYVNTKLINPALTWDDLALVRRLWDGPLLVKGITTPGDARRARAAGADGIVVSNHGGRQLDSTPSSISVLPRIVDDVNGTMSVGFDGGIRSGGDIAKAMALGADFTLLGRAWAYGLAAGGAKGVGRVIDILRSEVNQTLSLLGCPDVNDLDRSYVTYPAAWHGEGRIVTPEPATVAGGASA
jgi:L-lactate dehydrogenase (cytochrome)